MSMMKRFLEDLSDEMGYDGEINQTVMQEGQRRLDSLEKELKEDDPFFAGIPEILPIP